MLTNSSRKLLCFLLSFIMTIGALTFVGSLIVEATICSQNYISTFFNSSTISEYRTNTYNERIEILAENSGIPVRVFEAVENVDGYNETVVSRFFSGSDTTMLTQNRIETYESLIKEYLDGNEISYDETLVLNTAKQAGEIYADCFGLKNTSTFKNFVDNANNNFGKISSSGLVIMLVAGLLIYSLYSEKKKCRKYFASSFTATGVSCVLIGLISLIARVGKGASITPVVYQNAIYHAITVMFVVVIFIGIVFTAISVILSLRINHLTKSTKNR